MGLAVLVANVTGCLVAPPIEREDEVNHMFTIHAESLKPPVQTSHAISLQLGQAQQFFAIDAVSDPDGDDPFYLWFVRSPSTDEILDDRLGFPSYTFDPCDRRFGTNGSVLPPQVFVEVVAADRDPLPPVSPGEDTVEEPAGPVAGPYRFPEGANVATVGWWWITLAEGGTCP